MQPTKHPCKNHYIHPYNQSNTHLFMVITFVQPASPCPEYTMQVYRTHTSNQTHP
uniref:Uncharacterized protein n=1 Tax=Arundo donax TaxID=35708 RepID=A0A0A9CIC3_ARUDO